MSGLVFALTGSPMPLIVPCPYCSKPIIAHEAFVGVATMCPHCGRLVTQAPPPTATPNAEVLEREPRRGQSKHWPKVEFPTVFYVAAWILIVTCVLLVSGLVSYTVRNRDTIFSPY
jgi:hypothetical protein